jgi:ABC-type spermidine/putrescine transport system permease subunit II
MVMLAGRVFGTFALSWSRLFMAVFTSGAIARTRPMEIHVNHRREEI